jgi:uncharacterized protein
VEVDDNIRLIHEQFAAFGRGDLPAALSQMSEDVEWQAPVSGHPDALPWGGRRLGRKAVADYFRLLGGTVRPQPFEGLVFTASGDRVVVEGRNAGTVLSNGKRYEHEWVMVFTVRRGQIVRFRHYYDPADISEALT